MIRKACQSFAYHIVNFIYLALLITPINTFSQNNLFLVDTLNGTSSDNALLNAKGIGDFNEDGYADFIVCYKKSVDLFFGNPQFNLKPVHRFNLPASTQYFQGTAYGIGDVNGDGYDDLMIISGDTLYYPIYPYGEIVFGGKELDTIPRFKYYPPYRWNMMMSSEISKLGDINGDGYNDFAIASYYNWDNGIGKVFLFKGGNTLVDTPWVVLKKIVRRERSSLFGKSIVGIGDYNNDNYKDFLISETSFDGDSDLVYLFLGNWDSINSEPYKTYGPPTFTYLEDMKQAGDLNKNGKTDFIISAADNTTSKIFIILENNEPLNWDVSKLGYGGDVAVGSGGDINNDGYDDFIIGNTNYLNSAGVMVGVAVGFWGGVTIDTSVEAFRMEGDKLWGFYATNMDIPGDINGDGYDDVFIRQSNGSLGKLFIYSYKEITGIDERNKSHENVSFNLEQNYPNPFNPTTTINYQLPENGFVTLRIYDALGRKIKTLISEFKNKGYYSTNFDGANLPNGVYVYQLKANGFVSTKKMLLLK